MKIAAYVVIGVCALIGLWVVICLIVVGAQYGFHPTPQTFF